MRYDPDEAEGGMAAPVTDRGQSEFYFAAWRRAFDFRGVASRMEYWSFVLVNLVIYLVLSAILSSDRLSDSFTALVLILCWVILLVPSLSLLIRRVRDATGRGRFALLGLIPFTGLILVTGISLFPARDQQLLDKLGTRYRDVWRKSADYLSTSNRKEFWTFNLLNLAMLLGGAVTTYFMAFFAEGAPRAVAFIIIYAIYTVWVVLLVFFLMLTVPLFPLAIRRVRSATGSGWWVLTSLIPFIGPIVVLVLVLLPGPGSTRLRSSGNLSTSPDDKPQSLDPDDPWQRQRPGADGQ